MWNEESDGNIMGRKPVGLATKFHARLRDPYKDLAVYNVLAAHRGQGIRILANFRLDPVLLRGYEALALF